MLKRMKLQTKLLTIGILLTVIPLIVVSVVVFIQNDKMVHVADKESINMAYTDLDHIAKGTYNLCRIQHDISQQYVVSSLNTAHYLIQSSGDVNFAKENVNIHELKDKP